MTADDVLWSMQRAQTNDPKFYSRSLLEQVDKVEAPGRFDDQDHDERPGRQYAQAPGDRQSRHPLARGLREVPEAGVLRTRW